MSFLRVLKTLNFVREVIIATVWLSGSIVQVISLFLGAMSGVVVCFVRTESVYGFEEGDSVDEGLFASCDCRWEMETFRGDAAMARSAASFSSKITRMQRLISVGFA